MIDLDVNRSQDKPSNHKFGDASLGMHSSITRRDFLGATLLLSPAQLLAQQPDAVVPGATEHWNGYGGVGEYAASNGNTWQVLSAGHKLRNSNAAGFLKNVTDTGELYGCVVVGGGISGLAAAALYLRHAGPSSRCLILENHPIFGGEAKQNEFTVDGQPVVAHQGSAIHFVPYPRSFLADFYDAIGLHEPRLAYQTWGGPAPAMLAVRPTIPLECPADNTASGSVLISLQPITQPAPANGSSILSARNSLMLLCRPQPAPNSFAGIPEPPRAIRTSLRRNTKATRFRAHSTRSPSKTTASGVSALLANSFVPIYRPILAAAQASAPMLSPLSPNTPLTSFILTKRMAKLCKCFPAATPPSPALS
jgi:NAD(P)-binding Rossmann-like domain